MSPEVGVWNNPHNELLQSMVEKGLIGLLVMLAVFMAPGYLFLKGIRSGVEEVRYYAFGGMVILTVYFFAGQTVALFEHDVFNHFYILMVLLFASQISVIQRSQINE